MDAAIIAAMSGLLAVFTGFGASWLKARVEREQIRSEAEAGSIQMAAKILERHIETLTAENRDLRERSCPWGRDGCPRAKGAQPPIYTE